MASLDQNLTDLLTSAPELQQTPGLTVGLAQGVTQVQGAGQPLDAAQVGQSASLALVNQGLQQATQDAQATGTEPPKPHHHHGGGILGDIGSAIGTVGNAAGDLGSAIKTGAEDLVAKPVGHVLNAGLNEVTHTYRYIHDVWQRHGILAALGEMALIGAGAAAGVFLAPELLGAAAVGGILGGELAGDLGGRLGYQDSWKATANGGAYRDAQGYHVSPGRDFSRLVGALTGAQLHPNAQGDLAGNGALGALSGAADATFDLSLDPTIKLGTLMKGVRLAGYVDKAGERGIQLGGKTVLTGTTPKLMVDADGLKSTDVWKIYQSNPAVKDAFGRIANMDTRQVLSEYPMLAPMAKALGRAGSADDVAHVFEEAVTNRNYSFLKYGLPATSLTRRMLGAAGFDVPTAAGISTGIQSKFSRVLTDDNGRPVVSSVTGLPIRVPTGVTGHFINAFTSYAPFAFNSKTLAISGKSGNPDDPEFLRGFYSVLRYSQNADTAKAILAKFVDADTLSEKVNIIANSYRDALRASGLPDTSEFAGRVSQDINYLVKQATGRIYGMDRDGKPIRLFDDFGNEINRGLLANQTGNISFPDFNEWRRAIGESKGGFWNVAAKADFWTNRYVTTRLFKRLVLLSLGFAQRVSAGELIPAIFSNDAKSVVRGGLAAASAKLNPDLSEVLDQLPREAYDEGQHPLLGARVFSKTLPGPGLLNDFSADDGEATVHVPGVGDHVVPFNKLTIYHNDIADEEIAQIAKDYGASISRDELPHIRAAVGKALWGVSKAFVDPMYREVALLNILANDGHIVAPGIASIHETPHGLEPIHKRVRDAALRVGANLPKNVGLGKDFRLWDSGDANHPLFWKFGLDEAAADGGIRAAARAYHDTYRMSDPTLVEREAYEPRALTTGDTGTAIEPKVQVLRPANLTEAERELYATQAAIKADRDWIESNDPQAAEVRRNMAGYWSDPEKFSAARVEHLKGLTYGQNGSLQHDVIAALGRGDAPSVAELAEKDIKNRPVAVKGRTLEPIPETGTLDQIVNGGWNLIHPIINSLSRAPIYTMLVTDEYRAFKSWMDAGLMTKAEAHGISQVRALNRMLPYIHNPLLRNKFSLVVQNAMPFYFAQEQAYKRYGRAMWANPKAWREAQLIAHGLHVSGSLQSDSSGNPHIVFPGSGELPWLATLALNHMGFNVLGGVPGTVSGDTISLRSVVPEMNGPSVSPLVAVPLKEIAAHFPQADPIIAKFLGPVSFNSTMTEELIPNATLRRVWEGLDPHATSRAFGSAFAQNAAWASDKALGLWAQAEKIDPRSMDPSFPRENLNPEAAALLAKADRYVPLPNAKAEDRQAAMDRLKNTTRVQLLLKAITGWFSPLSPVLDVGDVKLHHELVAAMQQFGVQKGVQEFLDKNPYAIPQTVFLSDNSETNTTPPATSTALQWIDQNRSWIDNNHLAAAYLVPQAPGKFDGTAYQEELAMGLRQRRTPDEFFDAIYTAIGNQEYIPSLKAYEAQRAQLANDYAARKQLDSQWQGYLQDLQSRNPIWYDNQFSVKKNTVALQAYQQLTKVANDPSTPDSPMLGIVRQLIGDYQAYEQQAALAKSGSGQFSASQLKQQWNDYLDQFVADHPEAQSVAYGVFRRLAA